YNHSFFIYITPLPPISTLFPYTTLFRSHRPLPASRDALHAQEAVGDLRQLRVVGRLLAARLCGQDRRPGRSGVAHVDGRVLGHRSEEHTSELQSRGHLVCRLLLEKKKLT